MFVNCVELCNTIYEYTVHMIIDKKYVDRYRFRASWNSQLTQSPFHFGYCTWYAWQALINDLVWRSFPSGMVIFESIRITVWQHLLILDLLEKILQHSDELSEILLSGYAETYNELLCCAVVWTKLLTFCKINP